MSAPMFKRIGSKSISIQNKQKKVSNTNPEHKITYKELKHNSDNIHVVNHAANNIDKKYTEINPKKRKQSSLFCSNLSKKNRKHDDEEEGDDVTFSGSEDEDDLFSDNDDFEDFLVSDAEDYETKP